MCLLSHPLHTRAPCYSSLPVHTLFTLVSKDTPFCPNSPFFEYKPGLRTKKQALKAHLNMPARTSSENGVSVNENNPGLDAWPSPARLSSKADHSTKSSPPQIDIIDIRQHVIDMDLSNDIKSMLKPENGPKKMPTMLLYDEAGLQIFEEVGTSELPDHAGKLTVNRSPILTSTTSPMQKSTFSQNLPRRLPKTSNLSP